MLVENDVTHALQTVARTVLGVQGDLGLLSGPGQLDLQRRCILLRSTVPLCITLRGGAGWLHRDSTRRAVSRKAGEVIAK
jgi:hypothetical protein